MVLTRSQTSRKDDEDRRQFIAEQAAPPTEPIEPAAAAQRDDSAERRDAYHRGLLGISSPESGPATASSATFIVDRDDSTEPEQEPLISFVPSDQWRSELDDHLRKQADKEKQSSKQASAAAKAPPASHGAIPKAPKPATNAPIATAAALAKRAATTKPPPSQAPPAGAAMPQVQALPVPQPEAAMPRVKPTSAIDVQAAKQATSAPLPGTSTAATSRRITFAQTLEQTAPSSLRSGGSNNSAAIRKRNAEIKAAEEIAYIRWKRAQEQARIEEELVHKRLQAQILQIEEEGSRASGSRISSVDKVNAWMELMNQGAPTPSRPPPYMQPQGAATPNQPPPSQQTLGGVQPAVNARPQPTIQPTQEEQPAHRSRRHDQRQHHQSRSRSRSPPQPPRSTNPRQLFTPQPPSQPPHSNRERSRSRTPPPPRDNGSNRGNTHSRTGEEASHNESERARDRSQSRRRSGSGSEAIDRLADHISSMWRPPPRQVYELPTFNGEAGEWLTFYNSYLESTRRYNFSNYENVSRLRCALKGEARQIVQHMLSCTSNPDHILRVLKKNFGRTDLLVDRAIEDLKKLPTVGPSATDLNAFAIKVTNIVATLVDLDNKNYGANPLLVREITERLSPHLRSRWCTYARENRSKFASELSMIAGFLLEESDNEMEFSHARAPSKKTQSAAAASTTNTSKRAEKTSTSKGADRRVQATYPPATYAVMNEPKTACLCCGGSHKTIECRRVLAMNVGARWDWARSNRVCFKCLNSKHRREHCRTKGCGEPGCPHTHHRLLHGSDPPPRRNDAPQPQRDDTQRRNVSTTNEVRGSAAHYSVDTPQVTQSEPAQPGPEHSSLATNFVGATVLLKVIPIYMKGPNGEVKTYALLDEGSTISLVDDKLADVLGLVGRAEPLVIRGVGEMATQQASRMVAAEIRGTQGGPTHKISMSTVSKLGLRPQRAPREQLTRFEHLSDLENACYAEALPQVLIGADHWHTMVPLEVRRGRKNEPVAVKNDLGWVIYGTSPSLVRAETSQHCYHTVTSDLDSLLKFHFSIEALGISETIKTRPEDARATQILERTIRRIPGPHYEVGQLWRDDVFNTPPTYPMAFSRLKNVERKMDRDADFAEKYIKQVSNLIEKGYAKRLAEPIQGPKQWFLPHFCTENINKPGKLRLVFDAAAQVQGRSLNDYILEGPDKLQSLPGILYRFREREYAVTADIQEMFLRIHLSEPDQASQMFLWRGNERVRPPDVYVMKSIIFGAASSPFLAHSARDRNARDNAEQYPDAVEEITQNHYMDDYVASYANVADCVRVAKQVDASHKLGGFELRSWNSNCAALLDQIPPELRADEPTTMGEKNQKILGLMWDAKRDTLGYNTKMLRVPDEVRSLKRGPTKREALSAVMSIYDPLGLISHFTISAKIQLQRLWALKINWDEPLPDDERLEFQRWLRSLEHVTKLRLPRQYPGASTNARYELHIFVDASAQAYAAAAYWRITNEDEQTTMCLAAARAKVAPTKPTSIPRLELQAALIGARLQKSIISNHRIEPERVILWTDSKTVLHWVRDDARRYNVYVAHRLGEIAELTTSEQWRWVPTKENPADDATRADASKKIEENSRWYRGPHFLTQPEAMWPTEPSGKRLQPTAEQTELKKAFCNAITHEDPPLPDITRFSNYDRLIRATARMLQFIDILKTKRTVNLDVKHIVGAEHLWLQHSQRKSFPEEMRSLHKNEPINKKSRLYKLDPELSDDGVLRMRGRLNAAPTTSLNKKPIILDGREAFVRLLILRAHKRALHSNNEKVVNDLRQTYWILHLRPSVRAVASACRLCTLRRVQPQIPVFGDLPPARLQPYTRAFTYAAVDYMGPLVVTIGRRHEKRWVALFTCLTSRAIYLEVVHSLSTDSAIMALRRMGARRGYPRVMYSDNATCFRGADQELRAAYAEWLPALRDYGLKERMEWRFIPPGAPNQGGAWERLVRSVKVALTATLHTKAPKEEVLLTVLAEAENTINARPLTHVSVDPNDPEALTPAHFLLNGPAEVPPTGPCEEVDRRVWRASQALADHFWSRWVREYLPTLAPRQSSAANERQIQPGDYVLIADPNLPRNVWPRGIVVTTYPGPDGAVRSADVRTRGGVFRRPTRKMAVLPLQPEVVAALRRGGECQRQPLQLSRPYRREPTWPSEAATRREEAPPPARPYE